MGGQNPRSRYMTYAEQLEVIQSIPLREGDRKVIQCPFCYGEKKLALSKSDGKLMWNCYRASCNAKGIHNVRRNLQSAKNYLNNKTIVREKYIRPLPSITTSIYNHQPAIDYLKSVNSLDAYKSGYIKVRYDPSEDRVLFYSDAGAVGRSLNNNNIKWMSYGNTSKGIHVGTGDQAVLVEDVPSACSVSRIDGVVGVALLGTTLTQSIKSSLNYYSATYLVLDKDASVKAIMMKRRVCSGLKVRLTEADLKHLTVNQMQYLLFGM